MKYKILNFLKKFGLFNFFFLFPAITGLILCIIGLGGGINYGRVELLKIFGPYYLFCFSIITTYLLFNFFSIKITEAYIQNNSIKKWQYLIYAIFLIFTIFYIAVLPFLFVGFAVFADYCLSVICYFLRQGGML